MVSFPVCATVSLRVISAVGEGGLLVQLAAFRTPRSRTESLLNGCVCRSQFASSCSDLQLPAPTSTSAFEPLTLKMIALAANGASANARAGARRMSAQVLARKGPAVQAPKPASAVVFTDLSAVTATRARRPRSEERRVGKECRTRWATEQYKKT